MSESQCVAADAPIKAGDVVDVKDIKGEFGSVEVLEILTRPRFAGGLSRWRIRALDGPWAGLEGHVVVNGRLAARATFVGRQP